MQNLVKHLMTTNENSEPKTQSEMEVFRQVITGHRVQNFSKHSKWIFLQ